MSRSLRSKNTLTSAEPQAIGESMRKDPLQIIEKILHALEESPCSLNELSQRTKLHYVTVRRYVKIIEMVKEEPEIEVIKTRHSIIIRTRNIKRREIREYHE